MEFQLDAEWLGRVLETIPGFVLVVDRARKIRYINRLEPGYDLDCYGRQMDELDDRTDGSVA